MFRYSLQDLQPHPDLDITTLVLGFSVIISGLLARSFVISLYFISSSFHFFLFFLSFFPSFFSSFFSPFLFPYIYHFLSSTRFSPVFLSPYISFHFYFYFYPFSFFYFFSLKHFSMFFYYYSKYFTFYFLLRFIHQTSYFLGIPTFFIFHFLPCKFPLFFLVFFHEGAVVTRLTEQDIYITNQTRTRRSLSMREHIYYK